MVAAETYDRLIASEASQGCDAFTRHVFAATLSLSFSEAGQAPVNCGLGLSHSQLLAMANRFFPQWLPVLVLRGGNLDTDLPEDERCLIDLLGRCCADRSEVGVWMTHILARRCRHPNHLWQDLGLRARDELRILMQRFYPWLAARNSSDMKWKKFLYRTVCRDDGYGLCSAPSCGECDDFSTCFGDESGESLLARLRLDQDRGPSAVGLPTLS